jgi:hypothetical protein
MESDARYFQRRAREELAASNRAVTAAARDRRLQLANSFLGRLEAAESFERSGGLENHWHEQELREIA